MFPDSHRKKMIDLPFGHTGFDTAESEVAKITKIQVLKEPESSVNDSNTAKSESESQESDKGPLPLIIKAILDPNEKTKMLEHNLPIHPSYDQDQPWYSVEVRYKATFQTDNHTNTAKVFEFDSHSTQEEYRYKEAKRKEDLVRGMKSSNKGSMSSTSRLNDIDADDVKNSTQCESYANGIDIKTRCTETDSDSERLERRRKRKEAREFVAQRKKKTGGLLVKDCTGDSVSESVVGVVKGTNSEFVTPSKSLDGNATVIVDGPETSTKESNNLIKDPTNSTSTSKDEITSYYSKFETLQKQLEHEELMEKYETGQLTRQQIKKLDWVKKQEQLAEEEDTDDEKEESEAKKVEQASAESKSGSKTETNESNGKSESDVPKDHQKLNGTVAKDLTSIQSDDFVSQIVPADLNRPFSFVYGKEVKFGKRLPKSVQKAIFQQMKPGEKAVLKVPFTCITDLLWRLDTTNNSDMDYNMKSQDEKKHYSNVDELIKYWKRSSMNFNNNRGSQTQSENPKCNDYVLYEVELLSVTPERKSWWELDLFQQLELCKIRKERGTEKYKQFLAVVAEASSEIQNLNYDSYTDSVLLEWLEIVDQLKSKQFEEKDVLQKLNNEKSESLNKVQDKFMNANSNFKPASYVKTKTSEKNTEMKILLIQVHLNLAQAYLKGYVNDKTGSKNMMLNHVIEHCDVVLNEKLQKDVTKMLLSEDNHNISKGEILIEDKSGDNINVSADATAIKTEGSLSPEFIIASYEKAMFRKISALIDKCDFSDCKKLLKIWKVFIDKLNNGMKQKNKSTSESNDPESGPAESNQNLSPAFKTDPSLITTLKQKLLSKEKYCKQTAKTTYGGIFTKKNCGKIYQEKEDTNANGVLQSNIENHQRVRPLEEMPKIFMLVKGGIIKAKKSPDCSPNGDIEMADSNSSTSGLSLGSDSETITRLEFALYEDTLPLTTRALQKIFLNSHKTIEEIKSHPKSRYQCNNLTFKNYVFDTINTKLYIGGKALEQPGDNSDNDPSQEFDDPETPKKGQSTSPVQSLVKEYQSHFNPSSSYTRNCEDMIYGHSDTLYSYINEQTLHSNYKEGKKQSLYDEDFNDKILNKIDQHYRPCLLSLPRAGKRETASPTELMITLGEWWGKAHDDSDVRNTSFGNSDAVDLDNSRIVVGEVVNQEGKEWVHKIRQLGLHQDEWVEIKSGSEEARKLGWENVEILECGVISK